MTIPIDFDAALADFVAQGGLEKFPYPKTAVRIGTILFNFDFFIGALSPMIESDPGLAAAVLRKANATAVPRGGPCTTVKSAVIRLGARRVGSMVAASRFGATLEIPGPLLALRRAAWREGITSALICEALAEKRKLPMQQAFSCGLQHDIGRTLVMAGIEVIAQAKPGVPAMPEPFWLELVDRQHLRFGKAIGALWSLPAPVREMIEHHHQPTFAGLKSPELAELVALSDAVNALLASSTYVSDDLLRRIPQLKSDEERQIVKQTLVDLPGFVADLSTRHMPAKRDLAASSLIRPSADPGPAAKPADLPVTCRVAGVPSPGRALLIADEVLAIASANPLPERFLTEVTLKAGRDFTFWAEVMRCTHEGASFRTELRPFAMPLDRATQWRLTR